ncbi:MAG: Fic family protein [Patescibacteria group bacterium]
MNYLSAQEILFIHNRLTSEVGGRDGLSDLKTLKKAVQYMHHTEMFPDLYSKAAALFFAIAKKRPFSEQNLPTALGSLGVLLAINSHQLPMSDPEVLSFIQKDLTTASVQEITGWIKSVTYKSTTSAL